MTKRRRAANPIFSVPLTHAQDMFNKTGETMTVPAKDKGKVITCVSCSKGGGTLIKVGDNEYVHQNQELCKIMQLRR